MGYELQASAHATQLGNSLPILTLLIQIIGLVCFAHIVYSAFRRCCMRNATFASIGQGCVSRASRAFYLLIFRLSSDFTAPTAIRGMYDVVADYAATIVFLPAAFAAVRRAAFKPTRYVVSERYGKGHPVHAIFYEGS